MKDNKIRQMLKDNQVSTSTRVWSTWPFYTEAIGATGNFSYIEFVGEYAPFTQLDLENICRAAELHNMGSMMKVDFQGRKYIAQKAVAAGFQAILFADHHTADEVRETIEAMKSDSPMGKGRYGCPSRRFIGTQTYLPQLAHAKRLDDVVLAFMIEKKSSMDQIEEICSIDGVDMVQFGPSDYSMSLGRNSADIVSDWKAAERKMIETALRHGVRPRCEVLKPADLQYYIDLGVRDFSLGDEFKKLRELWVDDGAKMMEIVKDL
ncbi:MAG: 2,4-dihydroxyhept-2-ene-1,7-dioic acid aldolase [Lachnospiraceae bacterium]|nr:2,4-dihydroxyhept-2-ene-1,7-dioic acid aldolase [Lachnospiraceae bacterium]